MGVVGNLNYSFDDRYYVDFAYRTDGSSQFGKDKKFAPFYSAGIGWNIHNEKFMKSVDFIDRLKLRASYGRPVLKISVPTKPSPPTPTI